MDWAREDQTCFTECPCPVSHPLPGLMLLLRFLRFGLPVIPTGPEERAGFSRRGSLLQSPVSADAALGILLSGLRCAFHALHFSRVSFFHTGIPAVATNCVCSLDVAVSCDAPSPISLHIKGLCGALERLCCTSLHFSDSDTDCGIFSCCIIAGLIYS